LGLIGQSTKRCEILLRNLEANGSFKAAHEKNPRPTAEIEEAAVDCGEALPTERS
jgi:hypothetical protein